MAQRQLEKGGDQLTLNFKKSMVITGKKKNDIGKDYEELEPTVVPREERKARAV